MTEPTANEVPITRVPDTLELSDQDAAQFKLSPEGAALRAQMDKASGKQTDFTKPLAVEQLTEAERRTRALTIKDGDGGEVNLETGVVTPGSEDTQIIPDLDMIPPEAHVEAQQFALDVEAISEIHGVAPGRGQQLFDALADLWSANDAPLGSVNSQEEGFNLMVNRYGAEEGPKLIADAQKAATTFGPDFKAYLEATGAGNSPTVLFLLAQATRGTLALSNTAAKAKLAELSAAKSLSKAEVDLRRILVRTTAQKSKAERTVQAQNLRAMNTLGGDDVMFSAMSKAELRRELDSLQAPDSDLYSSDGPLRAKAIKKRMALQARLGGAA